MLSRVLYGIRASLEVGALSVLVAVVVGVPFGLLAGYWRWVDAVVSRLADLMLAFPALVLAVGLAAINGGGLANAAIALGVAQVPTMIRVVRAETLRLKERDFVLAAHTMHAGPWRILGQHILPNALSAIIVQATVIMPTAVLGEAILSFLGLGILPPNPSLGIMLSDAQQYLFRTVWPGIFPGIALALICLGFNLFGDALRDALDPRTHLRDDCCWKSMTSRCPSGTRRRCAACVDFGAGGAGRGRRPVRLGQVDHRTRCHRPAPGQRPSHRRHDPLARRGHHARRRT